MSQSDMEVVIGDDAFAQLARRLSGPTLVVMDANTREAAGERVCEALSSEDRLVFPQRSGLLAGLDEVSAVQARIRPGKTPVAVGSGVITDIVRYAAHCAGIDFVSVPTAASMDGYASGVAALQVGGVKVTYPARTPRRIFADPEVLAAAPAELTRAGVGDLLAKATARVDWLAAHLLYGESYDSSVSERVSALLLRTARGVERLVAGEPQAARELLVGLIESGTAMAVVGSSRPASGCEHHASHMWDLLAANGRRPHHLHGLQVGYATHFAMRLQQFAYGGELCRVRRPLAPAQPLDAGARIWLGEPTEEILAAVEEKQRFVSDLPRDWPPPPGWDAIRRILAGEMESFDEVREALLATGIPDDLGFLGIDATLLRATFRYSNRLRSRHTVVDFLEGQQALDRALSLAVRRDSAVH